jgi:hypothetical protein
MDGTDPHALPRLPRKVRTKPVKSEQSVVSLGVSAHAPSCLREAWLPANHLVQPRGCACGWGLGSMVHGVWV